MSLPPLTEAGELPLGVHPATIDEVLARFGKGSLQREAVAQRLQRIYNVARGTGFLSRFVVFGSFVTDKVEPNDVDVVREMDDEFHPADITGETAILFNHLEANDYFGGSIFWSRR